MELAELQSLLNLLQRMGVTRYKSGDLELELVFVEERQIAPQRVFVEPEAQGKVPAPDLYTELLGGRTSWPGSKE